MSGDRDPIWDELKARSKAKFANDRATMLAEASAQDDGGWKKHTPFHWSRTVHGQRLDYWPSRKKFMYRTKMHHGDVLKFMREVGP